MNTRTRILLGIAGAAILIVTFLWSGRPGFLNESWVLTAMDGEPALPGVEVTAHFALPPFGTRVIGNAGCNHYEAVYTHEAHSLDVEQPVSNDADCPTPDGVMEQEATYLHLLAEATGYAVEGDTLTLTTDDERTLTFQPTP